MKLAAVLALSLTLLSVGADGNVARARVPSKDARGLALAAANARPYRQGARPRRRARDKQAVTSNPKLPPNPSGLSAAPTPVPPEVREIDGEGLKTLLRRDGANARPLLVNFWATWCDPCRVEFPDLVKIDAEYRGRGLDFVTVSADDAGEIKTSVPKFLREMKATMPAYLLHATDTQAAINSVDPTWGGELPATFLFDKSGQIVFKHTGRVKPGELRAALDKVLPAK